MIMAPIIDSFLLTNKVAVKFATKLSVSIWGAFILALLMGLEHPIWAMITGLISFFAAEHAQVVKKCLYQCFSTVVGGIIGVLIMADSTQSPLMAALQVAVVVGLCAAASFNTRDMNVTFCFAILAVTVAIMVMIPVALTPTTQTLVEIFVDRAGAVGLGTAWACVVSAALWPIYSSDALRSQVSRMVGLALDACDGAATSGHDTGTVYGCIIDVEDFASHSQFEGAWGRRGAAVARQLNRVAVAIASDASMLRGLLADPGIEAGECAHAFVEAVREAKDDVASGRAGAAGLRRLASQPQEPTRATGTDHVSERSAQTREYIRTASQRLVQVIDLQATLSQAGRVNAESITIPRHAQATNAAITGVRTALAFMCLFLFWSVTTWGYGFLMAVVPVVLSITFSKLPHPDVLLKRLCIGSLIGIPPGLLVFVLVAQAPSAIEIMLVTGVPLLFIGLMGLSSMSTFAYSVGYCLAFLIVLLPQNVPVTDVGFAIERSFAMSVGVALLALLYNLLPRERTLSPKAGPATPFVNDVTRFVEGEDVSDARLDRHIAFIIDRTVFITTQEAPERRPELLRKAEQGIFLMVHYKRIVEALRGIAPGIKGLSPPQTWREEVLAHFISDDSSHAHPLVPELEARRLRVGECWAGVSTAQAAYLSFEDRSIREALSASP